jgi:hypothetical protein
MPIEIDFTEHSNVLIMIKEAQESEDDTRQAVREAKLFLTKRDGQWDPYAWAKLDGRFRGTFDMLTPIVDQISGEIDQSDFSLKVSPAGGDSSVETAQTLNGLIRNIRNISNADQVFAQAARSNVIGGFDAWEIVQDWVDGDAFDQDLFIRKIPNAVDSVWFDLGSVMQDRSDAQWGVKLIAVPTAKYNKDWPEGSGLGVADDKQAEAYFNKAETVVIGQLYYKKPVNIELVRMTNGAVYRDNDDFKKVRDELAQKGITIEVDNEGKEKRRTRKSWRVHSRMFDGGDWLKEEEKTVFDFIPIVPIYGNFDIFENKSIYYGKLEKLFDHQRVLNYAMSRDIEDGALSPSPAVWMTETMIAGHDYSEMNTDHDPVRTFNPDPEFPGYVPTLQGGPVQSTGLQTTIANMQQMVASSANSFNALQGNANPVQSGIAGGQQIEQGNIGSIKWFKALEIPVCHTGRILINAIPRVYPATRQIRILEEDGTSKMVLINQPTFDEETKTNVTVNDLTIGEYDVVCDFGPAFNSQQKETAQAFLDMAAIDPTIAQKGMDIWLKNLAVPGMDQMAERSRVELFNAGLIPESQWTDEEQQQAQAAKEAAAQQPPQEDPNLILAKAEELKGQADVANAQTKQQEAQFNAQVKAANIQLEQDKIALKREELQLDVAKFERENSNKFNVEAAKIDQGQQKIDMQAQQQQFDIFLDQQKQQQQEINDAINNLKTLREAMGVDSIVGPGTTGAFINQSRKVIDAQDVDDKLDPELPNQ